MNIFVPQDPLNTSYMLKIESEKLFFDMIHPPRLLKDLVTVRLWAITVFFCKNFLSILNHQRNLYEKLVLCAKFWNDSVSGKSFCQKITELNRAVFF